MNVLGLMAISALAWLVFFRVRSLSPLEMRLLHVAFFALWSFNLLAVLKRKWGRLQDYLLLASVAFACELIQFWTPGHDPEWKGLGSSLLGVVLGREAWRLLAKRTSARSPSRGRKA